MTDLRKKKQIEKIQIQNSTEKNTKIHREKSKYLLYLIPIILKSS